MPYVSTEPVESSNIERIGYLRKQQILRVVFKGGRAYDYPLVTEREYQDFMAAESKGSFFNRRIKSMYGHRNPRPVELVEPCCEHDGSDMCTKECFPCNEWCCPDRPSDASPEEIAAAIKDGLAFGAVDHSKSGDCPHGADGRTCEEGCGCIPCHVTQDEGPEAASRIVQMLGDTDMVRPNGGVMQPGSAEESDTDENEEEETNGNSD